MIELTGQDTGMLITINIKNITYVYPKTNGTRICFIGDTWINAKEAYETVCKLIKREARME